MRKQMIQVHDRGVTFFLHVLNAFSIPESNPPALMGKRSKQTDRRDRIRLIMKCLALGLVLIVVAMLVVPAINQKSSDKNDEQEKIDDQDHWEGIIKQHEIVPDVIDDAKKAAVLEVFIVHVHENKKIHCVIFAGDLQRWCIGESWRRIECSASGRFAHRTDLAS